MHVYDLTGLTRGAGEQRRIVVQSFDVPLQSLVLFICGAVAALPVIALLFPILGFMALFGIVVVELAVFWLFRWRSRSGLRLTHYQAILDRRRSHVGQFLVCGTPYDFLSGLALSVRSSSIPNPRLSAHAAADAEGLFTGRQSRR